MKHNEFLAAARERAKEISKARSGIFVTYEDLYQAAAETHALFDRVRERAQVEKNPLPTNTADEASRTEFRRRVFQTIADAHSSPAPHTDRVIDAAFKVMTGDYREPDVPMDFPNVKNYPTRASFELAVIKKYQPNGMHFTSLPDVAQNTIRKTIRVAYDVLHANPLPQTKPVTEQCRDCVFFVGPIEHGYAVCERYPQPIAKTVTQWCGEWKARE